MAELTVTDDEILGIDFFADDKGDSGVRARTVRIVTTRAGHECRAYPSFHPIAAGSRARVERAVVDGKWCSWYACVPCCEAYILDPYALAPAGAGTVPAEVEGHG